MADVLFVCVEDCCLKRVLEDNGKLTKILQTMCSSIQNIKRCGGVYANAIMPKVNVFKQYKILCGERMLSTLDAFALCVYNIIFFIFFKWVDCSIVSIGQLLATGYLTYSEFKTQIHTVNTMLFEGILTASNDYQKKLGLQLKEALW